MNVESWDPKAEITQYGDVQAGVRWPKPIEARLAWLLKPLKKYKVTKAELVAALILTTPADVPKLKAAVDKLRDANVGTAIRPPEGKNVVTFQRRGPGRPSAEA